MFILEKHDSIHNKCHLKLVKLETSLAVQWLRLCFHSMGLTPSQGTKIPNAPPSSANINTLKNKIGRAFLQH